jgi:heme a synthase
VLSSHAAGTDRAVGLWLLLCAGLVLAMIALGGVTRLTRSGLSIVEWRPVSGALPPLGEGAWQAELERYRATPEARLVNAGITLEAYRAIYLVEYAHRLLGRLTGAAFLGPLGYFWWRGRVGGSRALGLLALFGLGGLQGAVGWWMVKSGLVALPMVSPVRLAVHLALALVLLCALLWLALDALGSSRVAQPPARCSSSAPWVAAVSLLPVVALTLCWGALTAGLRAGRACPTFPGMIGGLVPPGVLGAGASAASFLQEPLSVQFVHRSLACTTAAGALALCAVCWRAGGQIRRRGVSLALAVVLQISLGGLVVTMGVPISLASAHQANGALVLVLLVALVHAARPSRTADAAITT